MNSDTPRTDNAWRNARQGGYGGMEDMAICGRKLERELTAAQKRIEELEGALHHPDDPNHTCLFKEERDQLKQQLAAMELASGVKDEALSLVVETDKKAIEVLSEQFEGFEFSPECPEYAVNQACQKALSTQPSELYQKVVEVISELIAACPHEAEGQQRAMAALKGRELLQLINARKETK